MAKSIGPPHKYRYLLEQLDDDELYTPASVVNLAEARDILYLPKGLDRKLLRTRIRTTLSRFAKNHDFPPDGDGMLNLKGQGGTVAWLGWRWKEPLPPNRDACYQLFDSEPTITLHAQALPSELAFSVVPPPRSDP